jgi:shikimate dehydrogenase
MAKLTYGIIGHPIEHSLSPAMQNAAFKALGLDAGYLVYDVEPSGLKDFLDSVSKRRIAGLNVTIPHKINAKIYLEREGSLDANAEKLGAVNTIKVTPDGLSGYNTDGPGFYRSLIEDLGFEPEGKNLFVLGAGGAARAVIMYLGSAPGKIYVTDVEKSKLADLKKHYCKYYDDKKLVTVDDAELEDAFKRSDLLVNATPVGMKESDPSPVDKKFFHPGMRVYDLVYNRPITQLVRDAKAAKLHAATGTGMLLYQGAIAFEIWTGKKAPVDVMKKALKEALKNQI